MTIMLNHAIVPARDKVAAAKFFARIFGLKRVRTNYFAPVRINKTLTLLFDDDDQIREPSLRFSRQQPRIRRHPAPHQKGQDRLWQCALEPRGWHLTIGMAAAACIFATRTGTCWS